MMSRFESWFLSISTLLVAGSGIVLYVMKDWMTPADPFAVVNHPWQPVVLKLHLVTVPFLVFAFGMVFTGHVLEKLRAGRRWGRWSGLGMTAIFMPLVLSGVLIQVLTAAVWLQAVVWIHLLTATLYLASLLFHRQTTPSLDARRVQDMNGRAGSCPRHMGGEVRQQRAKRLRR